MTVAGLTCRAAEPTVIDVSRKVLSRPFPPLPAGRAPELPLPEVVIRANRDSAYTLDGRLITVIGFTITPRISSPSTRRRDRRSRSCG